MPEAADLVLNPKKTLTYRICALVVGALAWLFFRPSGRGRQHPPRGAGDHRADPSLERRLRLQPVHLAAQGVLHGQGGRLSPEPLRRAADAPRGLSGQPGRRRSRVHAAFRRGAAPRSGAGALSRGHAQGGRRRRATARRRDVPRCANGGDDCARRHRRQRKSDARGGEVPSLHEDSGRGRRAARPSE